MKMTPRELLTEKEVHDAEIIGKFLDAWIEKNPYSKDPAGHNQKFKNEFNQYLQSCNFSPLTKRLFAV